MADFLKIENIESDDGQLPVLSRFNLTMKKGEINVLLGEPGSGKDTLLRLIAGLGKIKKGKIVLMGNHISTAEYMMPMNQRDCSYIPKKNLLFPHLTVAKNIQLSLRGVSRKKRKYIVQNVLAKVGLAGFDSYLANSLNRGQELRVAVARALALEPSLILINNPFAYPVSAQQLDFISYLRSILVDHGITALIAMEDPADAFAIADNIGIMHEGQLLQWDTPYAIYHHPQHRASVKVIGDGQLLEGHIQSASTMSCELGTLSFERKSDEIRTGLLVEFLIYPDDVVYDKKAAVKGVVIRKEFRGAMTNYTLQLNHNSKAQCLCPSHQDLSPGSPFPFRVSMDHLIIFKAGENTAIDLGKACTK